MPKYLHKQLIPPTDAEDSAITAAALTDPDNPPLSTEELLRMGAARNLIQILNNAKTSEAAKALTQEDINQLTEECLA